MQSKILDKIKLPIKDLKELQGDFKKLGKKQFQKLKNSIEKNGFIQPFFVWLNKGTYWILDGHQRKKAIIDLYGDVEVDCLTIQANSMQEAKKLCIFYSSSYAEFDKESLLQFADGLNFADIEDFEFSIGGSLFFEKNDEIESAEYPNLKNGNENESVQMNFIFNLKQEKIVLKSLEKAKNFFFDKDGNKNGYLISKICENFLKNEC